MSFANLTRKAVEESTKKAEENLDRAGNRIIDMLQLDKDSQGFVQTIYGPKSVRGLALALVDVLGAEGVID